MTIELTEEMINAFEDAASRSVGRDSLAGLRAVLDLIERDYEITAMCVAELAPGIRCVLRKGHEKDSTGLLTLPIREHRSTGPNGSDVRWVDGPRVTRGA